MTLIYILLWKLYKKLNEEQGSFNIRLLVTNVLQKQNPNLKLQTSIEMEKYYLDLL